MALERSLSEIVRRHESLRTAFAEADGSPVQVIAPFGGFSLPVEDLSGLGEVDREAAVRRRAGEEAARPGEIERRIYEKIATMSESEAEQLAESNRVAGG